MGQVIPIQNLPADLNNYVFKENETRMLVPLYDTANGKFKGIKKTLGYIMLRGDMDKTFFNYGYSEEYASILYSYSKQVMSNVFVETVFKIHFTEMMDMRHRENFSKKLSFVPTTTDRKEPINQYSGKVSLTPVDCLYKNLK